MKKFVLTAAALALVATPALAENAKSGARTLTPFGPGFSNYGASAYAYAYPASNRKAHALGTSTPNRSYGWPYADPRQGRADKK